MHGRRLSLTLFALLAALSLPSPASAADGDPDPTFSADGQVFVDLPDEVGRVTDTEIAQAPDGSLVVGAATHVFDARMGRGRGSEGIRIFRVSADGEQIDELAFVPALDPALLALRVLSDGRIGFVYVDGFSGTTLARIMADGSSDPTLTDGDLVRKCTDTPPAAQVRADGGAYLLDDCGVWAYDPDGDHDDDGWNPGGFGGFAFLEPSQYDGDLEATRDSDLFIAPDGKVVALVDHFPEQKSERGDVIASTSALVRFEADGHHDPTFGDDGVILTGSHGYDLTVGPDGRPVIVADVPSAGTRSQNGLEWVLQRFTTGGAPDDTFGEGGAVGVHGELCCVANTRVTVQPDSKVLMAANHEDWDRGGPFNRLVLRRYLADGGIDTSFAVGGEQLFQSPDPFQGPHEWGPPVLQSDGKILLPFGWQNNGFPGRTISVSGPLGESVGITRFNNPSLTPPVQETPQQQQRQQQSTTTTAAPAVVAASPPPVVVPSRRCTSRRSFRIRLRTGRRRSERSPIVSTSITVNGRRVPARRSGATVNLRNLPKGRFTVVIRLRLADGGRVRDVRRYRTCAQKIERELAPLRTRPPRKR